MQTHFETQRHMLSIDHMGGIQLRRKDNGQSMHFQPGDDAEAMRYQIDKSPIRLLDAILDDYAEVMS